jgi:hypothetical protein
MRPLLFLVCVLQLCACASLGFSEKFDLVEVGSSPGSIMELLGSPDERSQHRLPDGPYYGPSEGLVALLKPGDPFEEWVYLQDGWDYYVWFAGESSSLNGDWRVILTARYSHGAVFEPSNH